LEQLSSDSDCDSIIVNAKPAIPSLSDCFTDSKVDMEKYLERRRLQRVEDVSLQSPKKRLKRQSILARSSENGELEALRPTQSLCYMLYVDAPDVSSKKFLNKFCR
jgi:hypothetical protein